MAYGNIYTNSFYDLNDTHVEVAIKKDAYSGTIYPIKLKGDGFVEVRSNLNVRVMSMGAIVHIVNEFEDKFLFAKMMSESYETYKLEIKIAGSIYFEGFLLPQTYNQDITYRSIVSLTFSNGLKMLENITPSFLTDGITDYWTEMDILDNI